MTYSGQNRKNNNLQSDLTFLYLHFVYKLIITGMKFLVNYFCKKKDFIFLFRFSSIDLTNSYRLFSTNSFEIPSFPLLASFTLVRILFILVHSECL